MKHDNKICFLEEVQRISAESVRRAMQLVNIIHKNVENTNWFKEIKEIDIDIQNILLSEEEKNSGGFQSQIKLEHKEIFDELEEEFKKTNLEIIKFILNKYPPFNYEKNQQKSIDQQWDENKKDLISELCSKYALDNYPKETDVEKINYTIMSVISTKINSIYNEIK